ncbi:hypothetical protein F4781DRAFT_434035 [Annulohypoxylon bovei var. microspora]|nr:hypothetical protein F4781DRAFT_434035 [Annulohypoxylon bovei var. microspora]
MPSSARSAENVCMNKWVSSKTVGYPMKDEGIIAKELWTFGSPALGNCQRVALGEIVCARESRRSGLLSGRCHSHTKVVGDRNVERDGTRWTNERTALVELDDWGVVALSHARARSGTACDPSAVKASKIGTFVNLLIFITHQTNRGTQVKPNIGGRRHVFFRHRYTKGLSLVHMANPLTSESPKSGGLTARTKLVDSHQTHLAKEGMKAAILT